MSSYLEAQAALDQGDVEPALALLARAYRGRGLDRGAQALEGALLGEVASGWRELYLSGRSSRLRHWQGPAQQTLGFLGWLPDLFPSAHDAAGPCWGLDAAEVEVLVARLRPELRRALADGRKLSADKLAQAALAGQRQGLGQLIVTRALADQADASARRFLRARDVEPLRVIYSGRLGEERPLLSALDADDWAEILRLWARGWRPALEAVKLRLAARVDGAPKGGALDQVTSY